MSFADRIRSLATRIPTIRDALETEEATKNALVMPFIAALGYDVFNPIEVVPEFNADVGVKKGEKVDYAIKHGDEVVILVEAKKAGSPLALEHASQLYRYFSVTRARIAILTNGIVYQFYADLDEPNRMDSRPFLEIDLLDLRDNLLLELRKLTKSGFNLDEMLNAATDLKHMHEIRRVIEEQLEDPDEDFVRFFFQRANPNGRFVASAKTQFEGLVRRAFTQLISDRVGSRLRSALEREDEVSGRSVPPAELSDAPGVVSAQEEAPDDGNETTQDEHDAHRIVRAIVCNCVTAERVTLRDAKSYCAILIDDNNRKPVCRLHFNRQQKYVGTFDEAKNETKHPITTLEDIYDLSSLLREGTMRFTGEASA
ncbi:MAG: hypothetical protein ACI81R_001506 [Bradymonadia bacterium]|jgi:hypothetical protein